MCSYIVYKRHLNLRSFFNPQILVKLISTFVQLPYVKNPANFVCIAYHF